MDMKDVEAGTRGMPMTTQLVVSSTGTGDGRVLATPGDHPNIVLQAITPLAVILIRAAKAYVQTLVGLLSAQAVGATANVLPSGDFLHTLKVCAGLSVASGVMSLLTNVSLMLSDIGEKFPTLKA